MPNEGSRVSQRNGGSALEGLFVSETATVRFWTGHGYVPEYSSGYLSLETQERINVILLTESNLKTILSEALLAKKYILRKLIIWGKHLYKRYHNL